MPRPRLTDRFPERQLKPDERTRNFLTRRSGGIPSDRRTSPGMGLGGGAGGTGGAAGPGSGGATPVMPGVTRAVESLPADASQAPLGTIFYVAGAEGEDGRTVIVIQRADGTHAYRDVNQGADAWPASHQSNFGAVGLGNGQFGSGTLRGIGVKYPVNDNLFITSDDRVQEFTPNGTFVAVRATLGTAATNQVNAPSGIDADGIGTSYIVADTGNNRVILQPDGTLVAGSGAGNGQVTAPTAVRYRFGSIWVYVADAGNNRVQRFTNAPAYNSQWGSAGSANGQFNQMQGLEVGVDGRVYVVDAGNHRVQVFSAAGAFLFAIGALGSSKGQFNTPHSVAIDSQGNIYVTDSGNHRVQVFDKNGIFLGSFGSLGTANGQFNTPRGIAITDDYIYVLDSGNNRVCIFTNPAAAETRYPLVVARHNQAWAPGTVAPGGIAFVSITITGAALGDQVAVGHTGARGGAQVELEGYVSAANTVIVAMRNHHATSTIGLSAGTLYVTVTR